MRTFFLENGHSRKFMHAKSLTIGTNERLTAITLSEAGAITVCQMAINLKLSRVCMLSPVNRILQYKKMVFLGVYPYIKDYWKAKWKYTNFPFAKASARESFFTQVTLSTLTSRSLKYEDN